MSWLTKAFATPLKPALAGITLTTVCWHDGYTLDHRKEKLRARDLFFAFHSSSLLGAAYGTFLSHKLVGNMFSRHASVKTVGVLLSQLVCWRISYFPILVLSGSGACFVEKAVITATSPDSTLIKPFVYPTMIPLIFVLNAVGSSLMNYSLFHYLPHNFGTVASTGHLSASIYKGMGLRQKILGAGLLALPFMISIMISFTRMEDLRILPDHCYALRKADCPPPRLPVRNPYIDLIDNMPLFSTSPISNKDYEPSHALEAADLSSAVQPHVVHELEEFTAHQKVILYSGRVLYSLLPSAPSPWTQVCKGVLEHLFREDPTASSSQRLEDHYWGYLAASPFIGMRELPV